MSNNPQTGDLVGKEAWDGVWSGKDIPKPIDPDDDTFRTHRDIQFHRYFSKVFKANPEKKTILEVGCAKSQWLPYFALTHGLEVAGMDYSPTGCQQARDVLVQAGVDGEVHECDLFSDESHLEGKFDYVVSFGLVEHFEDTEKVLSALGRFLAPGGLLITIVPNTAKTIGFILENINKELADQHVPLTPEMFSESLKKADSLDELSGRYFMTLNLSVFSLALELRKEKWWAPVLGRVFSWLTNIVSLCVRAGMPELPNVYSSPYVFSLAKKKE